MGLRGASGIRTKMFMTRSPPIYSCFSFSWVLSHLYRAKRSILSLFSWVWLLLLFFFCLCPVQSLFPNKVLETAKMSGIDLRAAYPGNWTIFCLLCSTCSVQELKSGGVTLWFLLRLVKYCNWEGEKKDIKMEVEQNVNLEENLYLLILREYFFFNWDWIVLLLYLKSKDSRRISMLISNNQF